MKNARLRRLEAIANRELSNYDGEIDEYNQFSGGKSLEFVDFDGTEINGSAGAFPQEVSLAQTRSSRYFQFRVYNPNNTTKDFYLADGLDIGRTGTILEDDPTLTPINGGSETISVQGVLKDFKFFRNFYRQNPTRVLGFKVDADQAMQIATNVTVEVETPFHEHLKSRQIVLSDFINENVYKDKMVTVPTGFQLDGLTRVRMSVSPNTTVTITLYIGAVLSQSKALHKMAAQANGGVDYATAMLKNKADSFGMALGM